MNSRILIPVTVFLCFVTLFIMLNIADDFDDTVETAPLASAFIEKFGKSTMYENFYFQESGNLINLRVNDKPGTSEPHASFNPKNELEIAVGVNDFNAKKNTATIFSSFDSGLSWERNSVTLNSKKEFLTYADPWIYYDNYGNLYHACVQYSADRNINGIYLNISGDNGKSWRNTPIRIAYSETTKLDRPKIKQSENNLIYVIYNEVTSVNRKINFTIINPDDGNVSNRVFVAEGNFKYPNIFFDKMKIIITCLENDNKIVFFESMDGVSFIRKYELKKITHPGERIEGRYVMYWNGNEGVRIGAEPQIIFRDGIFKVAYSTLDKEFEKVQLRYCEIEKEKWNLLKCENISSRGNDLLMPNLFVDENNNAYFSYYSVEKTGKEILFSQKITIKSDYEKVQEVVSLSLNSFNPYPIVVARSYMGDYNSSFVINDKFYSFYTDGRNGNLDVFASILNLK